MADIVRNTGDITIYDEAGNPVEISSGIDGKYSLHSKIIQNKFISSLNSSTSNLSAGATFTGTSISILNVGCIQVTLKTDQNAMIYVEQSIDGTNWDISDVLTVNANLGCSRSFQATASFARIRVTNTGASPTTFFRLQTILTPIIDVLPRALTADGRLKVDAVVSNSTSGFAQVGKAWSIVVTQQILVALEQPLFLLKNPSGSGKLCHILDINYSTDAQDSILRFYRDPTIITNGTAITPINFLKGGSSSVMTAFKLPTISSSGTILRNEFTAVKAQPSLNPLASRSLQPNENFYVTIDASNNKRHYLTVVIGESDV